MDLNEYSNPWNIKKIPPKTKVNINPIIKEICLFFTKLWWLQVTVAPEETNNNVLNNGTEKGSIIILLNFEGGQTPPTSKLGDQHLWKNPQKKPTKKNTSDTNIKIIPI